MTHVPVPTSWSGEIPETHGRASLYPPAKTSERRHHYYTDKNKIMDDKYHHKYRTKSHRMSNWDYSGHGYYFITLATKNRECNSGK